jgi:hypothetical protein
MESFKKKLAVSVVIDCSWSKLGAKVSTRICDLEPPMNREEKEIVEVKAGMSEEIERVKSTSNTTGIPFKAKKETARPSNRRRKIRVYIP